MKHVYIRMFGEFSLQAGEVQISDRNSRSKKSWLLIAYLLLHRKKIVSRAELMSALWNEDISVSNPENTLKIVLHRARTLLNQLWPSAGHELILYKNGGYIWNPEVPVTVDIDEFEILCKRPTDSDSWQMRDMQDVIALYRGEFLGKHASEMWILPLVTYYHNLYIGAVLELIPLMQERGMHKEVVSVCKAALLVESYHEPLHRHLMQAMLALGDYKGTVEVYEKLSQQMFEEMGVRPDPEIVALYRTALQTISSNNLPMEEIQEYLQESDIEGALQCDYDYFKILCHAESRSLRRNGYATHIALLTVTEMPNYPLTLKRRKRVVEQLGNLIRLTLRQSDAFAQCSTSQYILMLPQASYENSLKVCQRIVETYHKRYPHVDVRIEYHVKPLVPSGKPGLDLLMPIGD